MIRRIAWRMQALEEGGLPERARQRALEIADDADLRMRAPGTVEGGGSGTEKPSGKTAIRVQFSGSGDQTAWNAALLKAKLVAFGTLSGDDLVAAIVTSQDIPAAGSTEMIKGFPVIPLSTAIAEELLYFVPEPKSPHGVDVSPDGEYIVVSGKLDPHVTVYSFEKIQSAIAAGNAEPDDYGVPVLDFDACVEARIEVGLGPLHTQFDDQGYGYTSLFLEPAVARWSMGGALGAKNPEPDWSMVGMINVHYNVGHIVTAEGDTVSPDGGYLVSMNKWSIDRFFPPGPLLPQNFQLIDIGESGERMQLLYDSPIGIGEPHYAQIIKADKLRPWEVYPEFGWDPHEQRVDPAAPVAGRERIERNGSTVEVYTTAVRSHFVPEHVKVKEGDHVVWHITNLEPRTPRTGSRFRATT